MRACKAVTLRTLNRQRAAILLRHWAKTQVVLTPEEVSAREAVVHVPGLEFGATSIILGASAAQLAVADDLPALFRAGTPGSAVVAEDSTAPRWPFRRSLLVGLQDRASPLDTIEAFFRAALCAEGHRGEAELDAGLVAGKLKDKGWRTDSHHLAATSVRLRLD